jgi:hypothetical protein
MRRVRSTGAPTKAQAARWQRIHSRGCIACLMNARGSHLEPTPWRTFPEIHHLTNGARRLGHNETVALCRWHHQGDHFPDEALGRRGNLERYGPSYHRDNRAFTAIYGDDAAILTFQNHLIEDLR